MSCEFCMLMSMLMVSLCVVWCIRLMLNCGGVVLMSMVILL